MVELDSSHEAATYFMEMVKKGKTIYGKDYVSIRPTGWFTSGNYSSRRFDLWVETAFPGVTVKEQVFFFFKRRLFEHFGDKFNFKNDPYGMSVSLIPLEECARLRGLIVVVLANGMIYDHRAKEWLEWCRSYEHRGVIRVMEVQNNGQHLEASIGMSQIRKVGPTDLI